MWISGLGGIIVEKTQFEYLGNFRKTRIVRKFFHRFQRKRHWNCDIVVRFLLKKTSGSTYNLILNYNKKEKLLPYTLFTILGFMYFLKLLETEEEKQLGRNPKFYNYNVWQITFRLHFFLCGTVRYHCGGWSEEVNSCILISYMVYL